MSLRIHAWSDQTRAGVRVAAVADVVAGTKGVSTHGLALFNSDHPVAQVASGSCVGDANVSVLEVPWAVVLAILR